MEVERIIKGAFIYTIKGQEYSEESFEVYKNFSDGSLQYKCDILSRVSNGEFLKFKVIYKVNNKYYPQHVLVDKQLGSQHVQEIYTVDYKKNQLNFKFVVEDEVEDLTIGVPPRFQISTPSVTTSFLCYLTKKYDSTSNNFYSLITHDNKWEMEAEPTLKSLTIDNIGHSTQDIKIGKDTLQATQHSVFDHEDEEKSQGVIYYLSKHHGIPYRISYRNDIKVEIKHLQNLEESRPDFM